MSAASGEGIPTLVERIETEFARRLLEVELLVPYQEGGRLAESVKLHLIADVPVGAFLSGGVDSSVIVAASAGATNGPLRTFSMGFADEQFSEYRVGLDHVGFGCANRGELENWVTQLNELGVEHGGIVDAPYGSGLSFRDPATTMAPPIKRSRWSR